MRESEAITNARCTLGKRLAAYRRAAGLTQAALASLIAYAHCQRLLQAYSQLTFELPAGMIHGDAWRGNLLRNGTAIVLADWDAVSTGPREIDLIPTLQAPRFGLPQDQRDAFITAYGHDICTWAGYRVLRDIRELSTITALVRDAHLDPALHHELQVRLRSLRTGDTCQWTSF